MMRVREILRTYWPQIIVGISMCMYAVSFTHYSFLRHDAFASGFDLGNMDQTVWNTLHGNLFQLSGDGYRISRFDIHADIILMLLAPFYILWSSPKMLLLLQSVVLASGAIPVFLLGRTITKRNVFAVAFVWVYLFNTGQQWTNIYDFHPVTIAQVALLWAVYLAIQKRWRWYAAALFIALSSKETVGLTVFGMGALMIVFQKDKRAGFATAFAGFAWFVVMTFIVMPHFSTINRHWALSWYTANEETVPEVFTIQNLFFRMVQSPEAHKYYRLLLQPFGPVPFLGLPWLLAAAPEIVINVMSNHGQMRSINLHYDALILPWLLLGSMAGVRYVGWFRRVTRRGTVIAQSGLVLLVLGLTLHTNYYYGPLPVTPACWCYIYQVDPQEHAFDKVLSAIPSNAVVSASGEIRPHITHREQAYTIPTATESAQYIAIINQNRAIGDYNQKEYEVSLIKDLKNMPQFELVGNTTHLYLFKRLSTPRKSADKSNPQKQ